MDKQYPHLRSQWLRQSEALREWRKALGWSQMYMVKKISENLPEGEELELRTYQRWERGQAKPQMRHYKALQQVFQKQWTSVIDSLEICDRKAILRDIEEAPLQERPGDFSCYGVKKEEGIIIAITWR